MNPNPEQTAATARNVAAGSYPLAIFGFDRITLWLDRPEIPIAPGCLKKHCTELTVCLAQLDYQAHRKLKLDIFQPTSKCLQLLASALGSDVATYLIYVEIACDLQANSKKQALLWRNKFLASAKMRYQRQSVVRVKTTWYYGRRTEGNNRRGNVLAVYADRPSKLNNAQPDANTPCLHIEWRASGSAALATLGIVSLEDLIRFDHQRFWNDHIILYHLPKPTTLGRFLAKGCSAEINVSGSALRKRAARWQFDNSIKEKFIMHNALKSTPKLARKLTTEPFWEWLTVSIFL